MPFRNHYPITLRQQGTTLIVVLVLILLATIMGLFALNVNLGEQRASGNDFKARLMREAAEAGMTEGMAYMQSLKTTEIDPFVNTREWKTCPSGTDTSFPCGAVPQTGVNGKVRRANMWYYAAGTDDMNGVGGVDAMEKRMLPLSNRLTKFTTTGNGFGVQYGVGVVLCPLKMPLTATQTDIDCATTAGEESGTYAYTLVAQGSIPGESAHVTLTQTIGAYTLLNNPVGAPPIVASGSIDVTGTADIVTNPNSGGYGVPVSMWTRGAVDKTGSTGTCYYDEFIRDGKQGNSNPTLAPPLNSDPNAGPIVTQSDQILRCDDCQCIKADRISFGKPGNTDQLDMDILQCSTGPATPCDGTQRADPTANFDIKPNEFPCDLFQFVFRTASHTDQNNDYFCEKQISVKYTTADGNPNPAIAPGGDSMGADERYLYMHAVKIHATAANAKWVKAAQTWSGCSTLGTSDYGIYWDQAGCTVKANTDGGSILYPLVLVADANMTVQGTFFGLAFVRATTGDLDPTTGGNALFNMNSKAAVYGAVVVQGKATKVNGNAAIIYSDKVLANIGKNSVPPAWGSVPGSWTDRFSY